MRDLKWTHRSWVRLFSVYWLISLLTPIPDMDSFLPSAILRYHQLLVPALQLALSMMTTLGQQHASATTQVRLT